MEKNAVFYGVIGLIIGSLLTLAASSNQPSDPTAMKKDQAKTETTDTVGMMSMHDMVEKLKGKKDDEFDKTFIKLMIDHHQGAIDMAKEAQLSAKHEEIKKLADDIIKAQMKETEMMGEWNKSWGY